VWDFCNFTDSSYSSSYSFSSTLWDLHDLQQLYTMVPCGAMDPVNVHNRIATNEEETCETKKHSFLLGLSDDAYNLNRNFLEPWTIFS
jgi:hypothetical protein